MESTRRATARPRPESPPRRAARAFCTRAAIAAVLLALTAGATRAGSADFAAHTEAQLRAGAVSLPLNAEVEYAHALAAMRRGDLETAQKHLESSIALAPTFTDSYFTLARLEARRLSPDAVFRLLQGVSVAAHSFEAQSIFAANAAIALVLMFLIASGIVWIAFAIRYLPFLAHRLGEWLQRYFNAAVPRACALLFITAPFLLIPSYATGVALVLIASWPFMQRRERLFSFVTAGAFVALAWFAPLIDRYSTVADPLSLTSLIAQANESAADPTLTALIGSTPSRGLDAEQQTAMGLLAMRAGDQETAVAHFLRAISSNPKESIAYVNLGNVYYLNGQYDKALEGYRKAEQVNPVDAVGQYNLAQAYIKTLLMSESSKALERASQAGFDPIRDSFAQRARATWSIYPRIYGARDLWRMAAIEGRHENAGLITHVLASATGQSARTGFWIVAAAILLSVIGQRIIARKGIAFQCSNCGEITCTGCCNAERGAIMCAACSKAIGGVTSDKVIEALLRQRRQSVIVKRRKSIKWVTVWVPGVRHLFYGRLVAGFVVASLFAGSVVALWARGFALPRWSSLDYPTPLWMWILPGVGIILSFVISVTSRQLYEIRWTRGTLRQRGDGFDDASASQSA